MLCIGSVGQTAGHTRKKKSGTSKISCTVIALLYEARSFFFWEGAHCDRGVGEQWLFFFCCLFAQVNGSTWVPCLTTAIEGHLWWWSLNFTWHCGVQVCSWRKCPSSASRHEGGSPLVWARGGWCTVGSGQAFSKAGPDMGSTVQGWDSVRWGSPAQQL